MSQSAVDNGQIVRRILNRRHVGGVMIDPEQLIWQTKLGASGFGNGLTASASAGIGDVTVLPNFDSIELSVKNSGFSLVSSSRGTVRFNRHQKLSNDKGRCTVLSSTFSLSGSILFQRKEPSCSYTLHYFVRSLVVDSIEEAIQCTEFQPELCNLSLYPVPELRGTGVRKKCRLMAVHALGAMSNISHFLHTIRVAYKTVGGKSRPEGRLQYYEVRKDDLETLLNRSGT